jgi:hypothetical protein
MDGVGYGLKGGTDHRQMSSLSADRSIELKERKVVGSYWEIERQDFARMAMAIRRPGREQASRWLMGGQ